MVPADGASQQRTILARAVGRLYIDCVQSTPRVFARQGANAGIGRCRDALQTDSKPRSLAEVERKLGPDEHGFPGT